MAHLSGWNKKGGVLCLRRSGFAQTGRHVGVLTDSSVRSARPSDCGLPFGMTQGRTGRAPSARLRAGFLNTPPFSSYGPDHAYVYE